MKNPYPKPAAARVAWARSNAPGEFMDGYKSGHRASAECPYDVRSTEGRAWFVGRRLRQHELRLELEEMNRSD